MQLSTTIASSAVVIGFLVAAGYANSQDAAAGATAQTWQAKVEAREAQRRVAVEDHKKRKEDFAKRCTSQPMTPAQLADCKAIYRKL